MSSTPVQKTSRIPMDDSQFVNSPGRRTWIQGSATALTMLFLGSQLPAQEAPLRSTLDSMSSVTGLHLGDQWLEPVATLVNVILEDSKPLRTLELGTIEPATHFTCG